MKAEDKGVDYMWPRITIRAWPWLGERTKVAGYCSFIGQRNN